MLLKLHSWNIFSQDLFERYLQKMLSRVITPLESFTRAPGDFSCTWAQDFISVEIIRSLWGSSTRLDTSSGNLERFEMKGVAIVDNTVEMDVIRKAREELKELEEMGQVTPSKDPCVWAVSFQDSSFGSHPVPVDWFTPYTNLLFILFLFFFLSLSLSLHSLVRFHLVLSSSFLHVESL